MYHQLSVMAINYAGIALSVFWDDTNGRLLADCGFGDASPIVVCLGRVRRKNDSRYEWFCRREGDKHGFFRCPAPPGRSQGVCFFFEEAVGVLLTAWFPGVSVPLVLKEIPQHQEI